MNIYLKADIIHDKLSNVVLEDFVNLIKDYNRENVIFDCNCLHVMKTIKIISFYYILTFGRLPADHNLKTSYSSSIKIYEFVE